MNSNGPWSQSAPTAAVRMPDPYHAIDDDQNFGPIRRPRYLRNLVAITKIAWVVVIFRAPHLTQTAAIRVDRVDRYRPTIDAGERQLLAVRGPRRQERGLALHPEHPGQLRPIGPDGVDDALVWCRRFLHSKRDATAVRRPGRGIQGGPFVRDLEDVRAVRRHREESPPVGLGKTLPGVCDTGYAGPVGRPLRVVVVVFILRQAYRRLPAHADCGDLVVVQVVVSLVVHELGRQAVRPELARGVRDPQPVRRYARMVPVFHRWRGLVTL